MSFVLRARPIARTRHVEGVLNAYVDRTLPAATLLAHDQHVSICPACRGAVDDERRLLSSLRTAATPDPPRRLESALLGLAIHAGPVSPVSPPSRLVVVGRAAPAMHRSPMRAAMLASLAAGASAAAAWSVGVGGVAPAAASQSSPRAVAPATTVRLSAIASGSQPASLVSSRGAAAGVAGSPQLTTAFTAPASTTVPVAGPWTGVPYGAVLRTIEP